jgi:hypothetical protein
MNGNHITVLQTKPDMASVTCKEFKRYGVKEAGRFWTLSILPGVSARDRREPHPSPLFRSLRHGGKRSTSEDIRAGCSVGDCKCIPVVLLPIMCAELWELDLQPEAHVWTVLGSVERCFNRDHLDWLSSICKQSRSFGAPLVNKSTGLYTG